MSDSTANAEVRPDTPRRRPFGRWLAVLLLLLTLLALAFTAYQAVQARAAMDEASTSLQRLRDAVAANDPAAAQQALADAQASTAAAHDNTTGPVWWLGSQVPVVGDDVAAVRTVAEVGDDLTHLVLPGLVEASRSLTPADLQPTDGRVNIEALERVAPEVVAADRELGSRVERVNAIDTGGLVGPLVGPVSDLQNKLTEVDTVIGRAAKAVQLLPPMLGSQERRTYLVLFQNNAETRATGGIPGAVAVVTADDGRIELGRQGTAADLGEYEQPVLPLTQDEVALYDAKLGVYGQDINFTPDFPRTAQLAREMWQRSTGTTVDGVVSTDPVGLSYLLRGTGPVALPGGRQLTADNAVDLLLNDVYMTIPDQQQQNAFFATAARDVFEAVTSGRGNPAAIAEAVVQVAEEGRLLVWSAHDSEQALLSDTALAGALPDEPAQQPAVGVYLNDGTGAKMGYYLDYDVRTESLSCDDDGRQQLRTTVRLRSTAPPDAASLPEPVIGPGFGARPGDIRVNVMLYAPFGGELQQATFDGQPLGFARLDHDGRPVGATTVDIAPGEDLRLTFEHTSGPGQPGTPDVRVTPGAQAGDEPAVEVSACA